jgi:predicted aldo/keto reductase-like oxidoreductase
MYDYAFAHGINFIDMYTSNPDFREQLGRWVKDKRERFVLQSHLCTVWENGQYLRTRDFDKVKSGFELMMRQLDTGYLDVGMIHYVDAETDYDMVFGGPIVEYAQALKREGRIRHVGVSSHNPRLALKMVQTGLVDVLLFSINPAYDLQPTTEDVEEYFDNKNYEGRRTNIDPERQALYDYCANHGIAIDVMKVYGGGNLLSDAQSPFGKALTPVQCIHYALTRPGVVSVMVGCNGIDEIKAALAWCDASDDERDYTGVMSRLERFSWTGKCMYCGHCAPCTMGIPIADVNKFYNLTVAEGKIAETVREHYAALSCHASDCVACGECETRCPFGVEIIEGMEKAAETFGY